MSTYLQLVQRLRQEAGVSGTGPVTVIGQTGETKRLVDWINSAWLDIQLFHPTWNWMVGSVTFQTVAGQQSYTPAESGVVSRFGRWNLDSFRLGLNPPNDERKLDPISYSEFRQVYLTGPRPQARPVCITQYPDQSLGLGYLPNDAYTVAGEYWKLPQTLSADNDVPEMPGQFHEAIVYRALMLYARYESAGEIYEDAQMNYRRLMTHLQNHQLPGMAMTEPLA